jgi:Arc/MetJ family transcription regulator
LARRVQEPRRHVKHDAFKRVSIDATFDAQEIAMRTTVTISDSLMKKAQDYTGIQQKSALLDEALKLLVAREAGRRLAAMGGTEPDFQPPPRRRFPAK